MFHAHPVPFSGTLWRIQGPAGFICHVTSDKEQSELLRLLNLKETVPASAPLGYAVVYEQDEKLAKENGEPSRGLIYGPGGRTPYLGRSKANAELFHKNLIVNSGFGVKYSLCALVPCVLSETSPKDV